MAIDSRYGHDLLDNKVLKKIQGWIDSSVVWGLWAGAPCSSFSRARRAPCGRRFPQLLRSSQAPGGLDDLKPSDVDWVRLGNELARRTAVLLRRAWKRGIVSAEENPWQSFLWDLPSRQALKKHAEDIVFDQCAFGTTWRGRTRVRLVNVDHHLVHENFDAYLCCAREPCRFSGRPHLKLSGKDGSAFRTAAKAKYPEDSAKKLVTWLVGAALNRSAAARWRRSGLTSKVAGEGKVLETGS